LKAKKYILSALLAAALCLSGCSIRTVDQLYCLPKRSEDYIDLQSAIDKAMSNLEYCAPLSGENRQTVQMADLDGDVDQEYLLFAKGGTERPLRILIFDQINDTYQHTDTIESNGTAFDQVEYVQMDGQGGMEVVVGSQVSDQVLRSVSVYSLSGGAAEQLVCADYTKFLTVDLDRDSLSELFILRPGQSETDNGVAELYGVENGTMERSNEVDMSGPVDKLRRILVGKLHDGETAVYAASTVEDTALITDVYAYISGMLANVSFSNESGTSVKTLRNYYVYADDIDNDGVMELPALIPMIPLESGRSTDRQELIRWYAMKADGTEVDKMYTYHNFMGGWYMELGEQWAPRLVVSGHGNAYEFYLWNETCDQAEKLFTVYSLTGQNREEQSIQNGRFVLYKSETVTYCASIEENAGGAITRESIIHGFHLIQQDWKTGET